VKAELTTRLGQAGRWGFIGALALGYALLSYLSATSTQHALSGALVAVTPLLGLGLLMAWNSSRRVLMLMLWMASCIFLYGIKDWLITHNNWIFLLEHAGTYLLLCATFALTLRHGETPMVERFAGIVHGALSPMLVRYTRSVTWAWTLYFGGIAGLSMLLFWLAPIDVWSGFAYLLGIPLLVLMFAGEYAVRWCVLPAAERAGPLDAIRAYRQASSQRSAHRP
jgi:uncharacterized membrane protein